MDETKKVEDSRALMRKRAPTLDFDSADTAVDLDATIVPDEMQEPLDVDRTLQTLRQLRLTGDPVDNATIDLKVRATLGEGGMGLVRLAKQTSLDRDVAVKTTKPGVPTNLARDLLQEAYVTGHLEHPNIIPIYTLGKDEAGAPVIVMKRVEGKAWDELLAREHASDDFDPVPHIHILMSVASAVRFAHSRGVIHRDIKPENVMIGEFDEVYLLDWGIALSLRPHDLLPTRDEVQGIGGTPCYMAPEMTKDTPDEVDEATDVYLLGATLYHVLTGKAPHDADSLIAVMFDAFQSEPFEFPDDVPEELQAIVHRACAKEKEDRYPSAEAFRDALAAYLEHRDAIELAEHTEQRRHELETLLSHPELAESRELRIEHLHAECDYGFKQALNMWSENELARQGLRRLQRSMARYLIDAERPVAAQACVADLEGEEAERLSAEIEELAERLASQQEEIQRLQRLEEDLDLRQGTQARSRMAIVLGILWGALNVWAGYTIGDADFTPAEAVEDHLIASVRNVVLVVVVVFAFRKKIFTNVANRRLIHALFAMLGVMVAMRIVMYLTTASLTVAQSADFILFGLTATMIGVFSDKRIIGLALTFFVAAILGVVYPAVQLYIFGVANIFFFFGLAWIWSPAQMGVRQT